MGLFSGMDKLKTIKLPESLKKIPFILFENDTSLASVRIPDSVEWIDPSAFSGCEKIKSFDDLVPGAYGIPEPSADTEMMLPEYIDLIILPCVSCDRNCNRIGHGAGYYDKYLTTVRRNCFTMALCYEEALADELPAEEHDMPVDAVVTEKTVYRWRT